jgi:hypothetical protein
MNAAIPKNSGNKTTSPTAAPMISMMRFQEGHGDGVRATRSTPLVIVCLTLTRSTLVGLQIVPSGIDTVGHGASSTGAVSVSQRANTMLSVATCDITNFLHEVMSPGNTHLNIWPDFSPYNLQPIV